MAEGFRDWPAVHEASAAGKLNNERQLFRVERLVFEEGQVRGSRLVRLINGGGLELDIVPDRCLDLAQVSFRGIPLGWQSPAPWSAPAFGNPAGRGWMRSFAGGFLTTCGLDHFGDPATVDGADYGLHGQATWLAAEHLNTHAPGLGSAGGDVWVSGELKQAALFGENLSLHRTIRSSVGSRSFGITDVVTNNAPTEARHMLLYHFNLGWPLVDTATEISAPTRAVIAQNDASHRAIDEWASVPAPRTGEPQHVIGHTLDADAPVVVAVENAELGLRVELSFHTSSLPQLYMWRFFSDAAYVLGVEPASCTADAANGSPSPRLAAGQSVEYQVDVSVDVL